MVVWPAKPTHLIAQLAVAVAGIGIGAYGVAFIFNPLKVAYHKK